ncbi:MAG TPA: hypothetical protein VIU12_08425 [Chryseolinea sp.]
MAWQDFETESTADLIQYIQWMKEDPGIGQEGIDAFRAFCFRFGDDIRKKCRVICRNRGIDDATADELAERTFGRFLKYPKYKTDKCKSGDIDKCVKLYLYRFAANVLTDYLDEKKRPFTGDEEMITDFPDVDAMDLADETKSSLKKRFDMVKAALERLTPKHKIIYLTYKQYEDILKEGHYLDGALREKMQKALGLSQASIRKYKNEAFKEVDQYLNLYGQK